MDSMQRNEGDAPNGSSGNPSAHTQCKSCEEKAKLLAHQLANNPELNVKRMSLFNRLPIKASLGFDPSADNVLVQFICCPVPCTLSVAQNCQKLYMYVKHAHAIRAEDDFKDIRTEDGKLVVCDRVKGTRS